jgi:hypothetical protein
MVALSRLGARLARGAAMGGAQAPRLHVWSGAACDAGYLTGSTLGEGDAAAAGAGVEHCLQVPGPESLHEPFDER